MTRGRFYHGGLRRVDNRHPVCPLCYARAAAGHPSLGITAPLSSDRIFLLSFFFMEGSGKGARIRAESSDSACTFSFDASDATDGSRAQPRNAAAAKHTRRSTKPILTLGSLNRSEGTVA